MQSFAAVCLSLSGGMLAQVAIAQQSRSDSGQLEEIIVTAEKRETTVKTTPISLTAVSGADIQDRGLTDLGNLVQSVPGVSIRTSGPGMSGVRDARRRLQRRQLARRSASTTTTRR